MKSCGPVPERIATEFLQDNPLGLSRYRTCRLIVVEVESRALKFSLRVSPLPPQGGVHVQIVCLAAVPGPHDQLLAISELAAEVDGQSFPGFLSMNGHFSHGCPRFLLRNKIVDLKGNVIGPQITVDHRIEWVVVNSDVGEGTFDIRKAGKGH